MRRIPTSMFAPGVRRGVSGDAGGVTCVLVAASGRPAAQAYARDHTIEASAVLVKRDLTDPRRLRRIIREVGADAVIVHSTSWRRQRSPQLYEFALSLMPVRERYIVDEEEGLVHRVGSIQLAAHVARLPAEVAWSVIMIGTEAARLARRRSRRDLSQ